jgi:hypothetical protein
MQVTKVFLGSTIISIQYIYLTTLHNLKKRKSLACRFESKLLFFLSDCLDGNSPRCEPRKFRYQVGLTLHFLRRRCGGFVGSGDKNTIGNLDENKPYLQEGRKRKVLQYVLEFVKMMSLRVQQLVVIHNFYKSDRGPA